MAGCFGCCARGGEREREYNTNKSINRCARARVEVGERERRSESRPRDLDPPRGYYARGAISFARGGHHKRATGFVKLKARRRRGACMGMH